MRYSLLAILLVVASPAFGQEKIRFPKCPATASGQASVSKLGIDLLYVIEADSPHIVLDSPQGIISVIEKTGPLTIYGKFVDGTGRYELREFKSKQLWIVQALKTGKVELLTVPQGATKATDVIRKSLDVDAGQGPQPPPPPPPGSKAAHLTFIGAEKSAESLATNNDASLRKWLSDKGIKVHVLKSGDPAIKASGLTEAVMIAGGEPCVIVQDDKGHVIAAGRLASVVSVKSIIGGE